jgi:hypothetical protein
MEVILLPAAKNDKDDIFLFCHCEVIMLTNNDSVSGIIN